MTQPMPPAHPAAQTFPLMERAEIHALADDIRAHGQHEPIMLLDGKILDGRNRWLACELAGIAPRTQEWKAAEASPWAYAWSENVRRRHLDPDTQAALWLVHLDGDQAWQKEQAARRERANRARSEKAKGNKNASKGKNSGAPSGARPSGGKNHPATKAAAAGAGVSPRRIERAKELRAKAPEKFAAVVRGEAHIHRALSEVKREERLVKLAEAAKGNAPLELPTRYPLLYADPPWRYDDGSTDPSRVVENQYPTMTLEDICALPVGGVVTEDCILFLWATSPKLAEALRVVEAWGFTYRSSMVWVKDKIGMGYWARSRHELLLIATRGAFPTPAPADRLDSVLEAPVGAHSAKPVEMYERIERMYPSLPRLELFARGPREGWTTWGNQHGGR